MIVFHAKNKVQVVKNGNYPLTLQIELSEDAQIDKQLHVFWELGSFGITREKSESPEDLESLQWFEDFYTKDGRYQVEPATRPS